MVPCRHLTPPTHAMPRYGNALFDLRALFFHQNKIRATATRLMPRRGPALRVAADACCSATDLPVIRRGESHRYTLRWKVLDNRKQRYSLVLSASHRRWETLQMETARPTQLQGFGESPSDPFRGLLVDAIRFWEPRRLLYNFVLSAVAVVWLVATWPHFRPALTLHSLLLLAILALLANVCYCAAYLVDIPMQRSSFSTVWRRRRWGLLLMGRLFAILV